MQVQPSSIDTQSYIQLRPGESFYLGKTCLSLVPEEHSHLSVISSGPSRSYYDNYCQQISRLPESLPPSSPYPPRKLDRLGATVDETPKAPMLQSPQDTTPNTLQCTHNGIVEKGNNPNWAGSPLKREIIHAGRTPVEILANTAADRPDDTNFINTEKTDLSSPAAFENSKLPPSLVQNSAASLNEPMDGLKRNIVHVINQSPSSIYQLPHEMEHRASPKSRNYQNKSSSNLQPSEDFDGSPKRKKMKTAIVSSHRDPNEESQDNLQDAIQVIKPVRKYSRPSTPSLIEPSGSPLELTEIKPRNISIKPLVSIAVSPSNDPKLTIQLPSIQSKSRNGFNGQPDARSPTNSIESSNSLRSIRSAVHEDVSNMSFTARGMRILFASSTSVGDSKQFTKFLSKEGVKRVNSVDKCTTLCVGKEELKKTSKLILAVLLGREIIRDAWVVDSATSGKLHDLDGYLARDPQREAEWGVSLRDAIERGRQGTKVLLDIEVVFTPSAKKELGKGFGDLREIATYAGAKRISASLPKKSPEQSPTTIIIAIPTDSDLPALQTLGWACYSKEIISLSVLRGVLDMSSDEFLVGHKTTKPAASKKRKR